MKHLSHPSTSLAGHDRASLARWLVPRGATEAEAERAATRALRTAFRGPRPDALGTAQPEPPPGCAWDAATLQAASVPSRARAALLELSPAPCLELVERAPSADGATRLLFRTWDGRLIESVIIPATAERPRPRTTLCVSSQVGCARACSFCETGVHGLERHLHTAEMVDQYRIARALPQAAAAPISSIVFMGMGEPFDNLDAVLRAVELLCEPYAFAFAPSHVTVSTVGVADKIAVFFARTRAELAVSLNAPDDARRTRIMPVGARFDLASLHRAIVEALPRGRRILFQYALFAGYNDAPADAELLASFVQGIRCRVNVIPANPGPDTALTTPSDERVDAFVAALRSRGVRTLVRKPRGRDVGGACGQLAGARRRASLPVVRG
ncbi:MAG: 23S rRNA (adenine(2503)-C(2))-methyltransferase RlmN [Polyangiaceae bacterium]|nr:23S rRNA (adenine(2503)-C(2))-methyltransferase RlmN [Polyangiaceae bacterium]